LDEIDRKLEEERRRLSESSSGDERRSITESVRHTSERFDQQALAAMNELRRRTATAFDLAQIIVEQMETIYWRTLWEKPDFVLAMFRRIPQQRHLSTNNEDFDLLVGDGENAIKANDVDELRGIVLRLWDNQINTAKTIGDVSRLASVLRG